MLWFQVQVVDQTNDANIDLVLMAKASGRPWLANSHNLRKQQFEVLSILNTQTSFVMNIAFLDRYFLSYSNFRIIAFERSLVQL